MFSAFLAPRSLPVHSQACQHTNVSVRPLIPRPCMFLNFFLNDFVQFVPPRHQACQHTNVSVRRLGLMGLLARAVGEAQAAAVGPQAAQGTQEAQETQGTQAAAGAATVTAAGGAAGAPAVAPVAGWWAQLLRGPGLRGQCVQSEGQGQQCGEAAAEGEGEQLLPGLWLLRQLLPVCEHDKLTWEHLPGCSTLRRHMSDVRQLRGALAGCLAATMAHLLQPPPPPPPPPPPGAGGGSYQRGAAAAAQLVLLVLDFALHGTQKTTAAAFAVTALRAAVEQLAAAEPAAVRQLAAAVAVAAACGDDGSGGGGSGGVLLLRRRLLPLLRRQALQHPRDLQQEIHGAVLGLVPYIVPTETVAVRDALDLVAAAAPGGKFRGRLVVRAWCAFWITLIPGSSYAG